MSAVIAAALAVLGTLLGSITTGIMHRRATQAATAAAERAALRRDQIAAISAVAATAADHRRTSYHRRTMQQRGATPQELTDATADVHRTRAAMAHPLAQVRLLITDTGVHEAMDHLVHATFSMRSAVDIDAARAASITAHDEFLGVAGDALRSPE